MPCAPLYPQLRRTVLQEQQRSTREAELRGRQTGLFAEGRGSRHGTFAKPRCRPKCQRECRTSNLIFESTKYVANAYTAFQQLFGGGPCAAIALVLTDDVIESPLNSLGFCTRCQ